MSQHRGKTNGGGNHRGSIFRLIVGDALIARDNRDVPSWGRGNAAPPDIVKAEDAFEREVSEVIRQMPFLWVGVERRPCT